MTQLEHPALFRISTAAVPAADRLDFWTDTLSKAIVPMSVEGAIAAGFESHLCATPLGTLAMTDMSGSVHNVVRGRAQLSLGTERRFHLVTSLNSSWQFYHRRHDVLEAGDVVLTDSEFGYNLKPVALSGPLVHFHTVELPTAWLHTWLVNPHAWVGRPIPGKSGWGRALASFVAALTPEFIVQGALPQGILADQVGALLALAVTEVGGAQRPPSVAERALNERIRDCIRQRCREVALSAGDVAQTLHVSVRTVHRTLGGSGQSFARLLVRARIAVALEMLRSPMMRGLTIAEIGRRSGFPDASHFSRVIRRFTGCSPKAHRAHATGDPDSGWH